MTKPELDYGLVEAVSEHWGNRMPAALVTSPRFLEVIAKDLNADRHVISYDEEGYWGNCLGVPVWLDERFDQPVLIGGKDDSRETESS